VTSLSASDRKAIEVHDVSVTYKATVDRRPTLKGRLANAVNTIPVPGSRRKPVTVGPEKTPEQLERAAARKAARSQRRTSYTVEAVKHVSFDVPHGTVLGVVGSNGAGKSTLMRTLAGILPPTDGKVVVEGRVSTLLALGVGFNRKLSGRENVVLGGLAAGLSREAMEDKYDEIVRFAELEEIMDLPMRTYSSGQFGRLAFAVAVTMDPDVLLIDEALSVGDARFRRKASRRMKKLCSEDRTVVLVSHALGTIKELCDKAIWLDKGELKMWDDADDVVDAYTQFLEVDQDALALEDV
jgi:ABC-type polysaccharide/polyol phosphate transport system ATPase subunit